MPSTTADMAAKVKARLLAGIEIATEPILDPDHRLKVCYGHPGKDLPDEIISVGAVRASIDPGPISNRRERDITLVVSVLVSVFRGGPDTEQEAGERAHELLSAIEDYFRLVDNDLGQLAFWCFCTGYESAGMTDPDVLAKGRVIDITAEFTVRGRIR